MDGFRNHYRVLRVDSTADEAAIKAVFRRLARRYHPDLAKTARAARRFAEIREAYEVLSDPERRRQYDQVYRGRTALRPVAESPELLEGRGRAGAGSAGLGITLDVLGLRVGLAVDAALSRAAPRPKAPPRKGPPRRPPRER